MPLAGGDALTQTFISFGVLALAFGVTATIIAVFKIPKWIWIVAAFFVLTFTILLPVILEGLLGFSPMSMVQSSRFLGCG